MARSAINCLNIFVYNVRRSQCSYYYITYVVVSAAYLVPDACMCEGSHLHTYSNVFISMFRRDHDSCVTQALNRHLNMHDVIVLQHFGLF